MQAVLRSALEVYRRQRFLDEVNAGYAELRRDAGSWETWTKEKEVWDQTLSDGLVDSNAGPLRVRARGLP